MKHIISLLLIMIVPFLLFCQITISGKVESKSGSPISNASIYLISGEKTTMGHIILSDSSGNFNIHIDSGLSISKHFIFASYLNKTSDTISVTNLKSFYTLTISLNQTLLPDVIVESRVPVVQRMADRFIFTPNKLLSQGATSLDILRFAPLVQFDEKNSLFSIINKDGTIVYINNRRSNLPKEMIISTLRSTPASDIKNIEIITNPGSEYSANTTGGVININFKKMFDEGLSGNIMIAGEHSKFNTAVLNGSINYRKGKIGIRISPFLNNSFNYNTSENQIIRKNSLSENITSDMYRRYKVLGGGLGLDYDINRKNLVSFSGFYSTVNGKSRSSNYNVNSEIDNQNTTLLYSSPANGKDQYTYNFGNLYYQHYFDSLNKRSLTINIDYNQFYQENNNDGRFLKISPENAPEEIGRYRNILPQNFFNLSERVDYSSQINSKSKIEAGVQYSNTNVSNNLKYNDWDYELSRFVINQNLTNDYKYWEAYFAGYLTYTKSFTTKFKGVFGLRAEQINYSSENIKEMFKADTNYLSFFPNMSLSFEINDKNNISLAVSKKIRRPNIEQLFPGRVYYNQEYLQENNPFLQPVIFYNAEAMYSLRNKYYFSAGYTLFKNQYTQFIIPLREDNTEKLKKTYLNYGNTSNFYLSFFTQQDFIKNFWNVSISANINYSKYIIKRQEALFYTTGLTNLNYNLTWNNTFYISKRGEWVGFSTFKYFSPVKNIVYERENVLFSTDLGIRKTINSFSLGLFLSDIFNTNGKSKMSYISNPAFLYNFLTQKSYTRSIALNIRYSFGNKKLKLNKNKPSANEDIKNRIGK